MKQGGWSLKEDWDCLDLLGSVGDFADFLKFCIN